MSEGLRSNRGAALLVALLVTSVVLAVVSALVFVAVAESRVGRNHQSAAIGAYSAAAGVERAIGELRQLASWQLVPQSESTVPDFNDGAVRPLLADRTTLDLPRATTDRQASSNAFYPSGPNRPVWRLYAHASLARITSFTLAAANPYIIVWVADDPAETDGDPSRDSNGVILLHAEAVGVRGAWRGVDATLAQSIVRDGSGVPIGSAITVVAWRETR
jgi:hypothetical protein